MSYASDAKTRISEEHPMRNWWRNHPVRRWQRRYLKPLWADFEWPVVLLLVVVSIGLGVFGFWRYGHATGQSWTPWDVLYRTLQLLIPSPCHWGKPDCIGVALQIARILAPALAIYAAIKALLGVFCHQLERFWVRVLQKSPQSFGMNK